MHFSLFLKGIPMGLIPKIIKEVFRKSVEKPFTIHYPFVEIKPAEGYRGRIKWTVSKCTGCSMCATVCPANAIVMVPSERTQLKKEPQFIHYKCIFCGLCAEHCPTKAIELTPDYHLYGLKKEDVKIVTAEN